MPCPFPSRQKKILTSTWTKELFLLKSVGMLLSTSKGREGCPQQAHPFHSLTNADMLTWKWNMWVRPKRAPFCAALEQPRRVTFGQLHKEGGGALLPGSVGSAGLQSSIRRGFQQGGTRYLRDCQLPTLVCLEEKGNSSGTMQTEALNNCQRGATYWKLKVLSLLSQQTLDPAADRSPLS